MLSKIPYRFIFISLIVYLYFSEPSNISERKFTKELINNTTNIEIYKNNQVHISLNGNAKHKFYFDIEDKNKFIEKLNILDYQKDLNINNSNPFSIFDYSFLIIFFVLMNLKNGLINISGMNNFMEINLKVKTKLKDVAGMEYNKREILEFIDFFQNKEKYEKMGAKMPKGALFYGPPGTGKTLLAKAIAGECGIPFISTSGSDFNQMYVGVGSSRVRTLFEKARKLAPCVIFIDEIDAMARKRDFSASSGQSEKETTLNQLLVELDGFKDNENVIALSATNRLDILDEALLRPGRFDRKVRFDLPEKKDREKIFDLYLNKMNIEGNITEIKKYLSKISIGFSSADISNICNEACILAVRNKQECITKKNLEDAIDNVTIGAEKRSFSLNEKEKNIVAYHEAGHTIISHLLENANKPIRVSIVPRGVAALGFSQSENKDNKLMTKNEILDRICVLLGGRVSEEIFFPDEVTTGASDDIQKLTSLAYKYVTMFGMEEELANFHIDKENGNYSEKTKETIDIAVQKIINDSHQKVTKIIKKNKKLAQKIATELLERETLEGKELNKILNYNKKKR